MNAEEKQYIQDVIESEGFNYTFMDYTEFPQVSDEKFHELRKKYVQAESELKEYLRGLGIEEL